MAPRPSSSRLHLAKSKQRPSRTRTACRRVSYREQSSDSDLFDGPPSQDDSSPPSRPSRTTRRRPASAQGMKTPPKRKASGPPRRPLGSTKRAKTRHGQEVAKQKPETNTAIQMTGKAMPWNTLPYQILVSIFEYASWPLVADAITPLPSISWLLNTALCCKAFAEPALSALYYSPPLTPPTRAKALIHHLLTQNDHSTINYAAKVKYLDVEASSTLQHKYAGQDPMDFGALVALTPQLRGICIHRLADHSRYRIGAHFRTGASGRQAYQGSLFTALREKNLLLQDWTWNQSLAKQSHRLANIKEIHAMPPFQALRTLSLVNYEDGPLEKGRRREEILMDALRLLPRLTGLLFRMSTIVNSRLMPLLPDNLQVLEIFDCSSLESPDLNKYLVAKGGNLRQLVLDHNHSLNLSFLVTLAFSCPKLEALRMDLRYFNTFFTVRDVEPKYELLLHEGEVPSWPPSLQRLELFHLRKWSLATAEQFFSSLTDASQSLMKLRQLRIKASLDESGWRDRIGFRDKWTQRLQHVFLRKSSPPNPHLKSFAAFKASRRQEMQVQNSIPWPDRSKVSEAVGTTTKRSPSMRKGSTQLSRVEIPQVVMNSNESDSDVPLSNLRRSSRAKPQRDDMYCLPESSPNTPKPQRRRRRRRGGSNDSSSEDSAIDDDGIDRTTPRSISENAELPEQVQGMCDIVDVLIDNLRPTEEQFHESDFLDDEVSGDEDWNGDDDMPGDGYAW